MAAPAILMLEGGETFHGVAMGHEGMARGTLAGCALAAGFPDLLTDPSYAGRIVCFAYPHVGNAGVVPADLQSGGVAARAVIAREISKIKSNRLGVETMDEFLKRNGTPAIEGVDTRAIAGIIARRGQVRAVAGCGKYADAAMLAKEFGHSSDTWTPANPGTATPYDFTEGSAPSAPRRKVVVYDFGVKTGFLRRLAAMGCAVKVVPSGYPAAKALAEKPDGVVFSAGPGIPDARPEALVPARELLCKVPLWGVGVGAGVLAAAAGAKTAADGRSHIGVHPVGRPGGPSGEMTSQCHDFWIDRESLAAAGLVETHRHLDDGSVEGFQAEDKRLMGVLFHPEAAPGPRDSLYLFDRFHQLMQGG